MSRLLLLAVFLALLGLASALAPASTPTVEDLSSPSSSLTAPSACPNSCSSHGQCQTAGAVSTCLCDAGYLAVDCSVASAMKPMCWFNGGVCSYWQIKDDYLYLRVLSTEAKGWAGVMWGATDGMTGGQSTIMTVPTAYLPTVVECYSTKKAKPTNSSAQSIAQTNVTGGASATTLDVSFHRRLDTGLSEHFVIPPKPGTVSTMSVARGAEFFEFHGGNATFFRIDIAAVAAGTVAHSEQQPPAQGLFARMLNALS